MEFKEFKSLLQNHFMKMAKNKTMLFVTNVEKDYLWELYLDSFPPGTNDIYKERREFDCSCCRHFIKSFGNVVAIESNQVISIWNFETGDTKFQPVIDELAAYVESCPVSDIFVTKEISFGTDKSHDFNPLSSVVTWDHFYIELPKQLRSNSRIDRDTIASIKGDFRDIRNVFKRSLDEIPKDAIETVQDLISQGSIYRGEEQKGALTKFNQLHIEYHKLTDAEKENYCWTKSVEVGGSIGKIRNHAIGTILIDIAKGEDLNVAVEKFNNNVMAPTNFMRPKAIFTKKMLEQAQQKLTDLGLINSLGRRFATINDINVNNILFANKDSLKVMVGGNDVFAEMLNEIAVNPKKFDKVDEVSIEHFIEHILPRTTSIEVMLENRHVPNMVSLIAPKDPSAPSLFKYKNGFSWVYKDNLADSMKERVKSAGGNVDGVLRFSIQWNEDGDNHNDFDAHCIEPNGNHIYFPNKGHRHPSTGMLDVDIVNPMGNQVAVENITYTSLSRMRDGEYLFFVHNYRQRDGRSGFSAEIEFDGQIHSFDYRKPLRQDEDVNVARVKFDKKTGFQITPVLPASTSSRKVWSLDTNQFHPVSVCMFSPNHWDGQTGIGNKHYFFMLKGCINDTNPNGFFNEYLSTELLEHKRVFEALGNKMKVESSDDQLSGVGFSSTQRNSIICKLKGHVERTIKIVF